MKMIEREPLFLTGDSHADEVLNENGKHFYAEARKAASMILPESSDASELSGDDVDESDSSTSPAGTYGGERQKFQSFFEIE